MIIPLGIFLFTFDNDRNTPPENKIKVEVYNDLLAWAEQVAVFVK